MHELAPGAEVWAGEDGPIGGGDDGTCINGGAKNNSACGLYATTLWYANDLGIRAKAGFSQYVPPSPIPSCISPTLATPSPHHLSSFGSSLQWHGTVSCGLSPAVWCPFGPVSCEQSRRLSNFDLPFFASRYQRQDLVGGRYGLLSIPGDDQRLGRRDPVGIQPDFWINFMWKRVMGNGVLNVQRPSRSVGPHWVHIGSTFPRSLPSIHPTTSPQRRLARVYKRLLRCSMHRADWRVSGCVASKIGPRVRPRSPTR